MSQDSSHIRRRIYEKNIEYVFEIIKLRLELEHARLVHDQWRGVEASVAFQHFSHNPATAIQLASIRSTYSKTDRVQEQLTTKTDRFHQLKNPTALSSRTRSLSRSLAPDQIKCYTDELTAWLNTLEGYCPLEDIALETPYEQPSASDFEYGTAGDLSGILCSEHQNNHPDTHTMLESQLRAIEKKVSGFLATADAQRLESIREEGELSPNPETAIIRPSSLQSCQEIVQTSLEHVECKLRSLSEESQSCLQRLQDMANQDVEDTTKMKLEFVVQSVQEHQREQGEDIERMSAVDLTGLTDHEAYIVQAIQTAGTQRIHSAVQEIAAKQSQLLTSLPERVRIAAQVGMDQIQRLTELMEKNVLGEFPNLSTRLS